MLEKLSGFDGDPSLVIDHIVILLKYTLEINVICEDALMGLFNGSFEINQMQWSQHYYDPKNMYSIEVFNERITKLWGPRFQWYKDTLQDLTKAL